MYAVINDGTFTAEVTKVRLPLFPDAIGEIVSPLILWRTRRPDQLCRKDAASIRFKLAGSRLDCERRWQRATIGDRVGDDAIAMDICLKQLKSHPIDAPEMDLAISATLANALLGNSASAIFLSWVLKHRARIDPRCALFSDLWLVADF